MTRDERPDIHNYERLYQLATAHVQRACISPRNRALIIGYRDACLLKSVCGRVRLIRVMGALLVFARLMEKDFDTFTRADVESLVGKLLARDPPYSPETVGTYKAIIKTFLSWVFLPEEFPHVPAAPLQVAWLRCHVRARDKRHLERRHLLTPGDLTTLLGVARSARDQAIISMFWETGGRVAELGNLQLQHVTRTAHGFTLDVDGKTGKRCPLIVSSAPYLAAWLAQHPLRDQPESPLWVQESGRTPRHLKYQSIRALLRRMFRRAGLPKPANPHIWRHSRSTYCLANGLMNESQAKAYFGWTPNSKMLATYAHLVDEDANNAILRENHVRVAGPLPVMAPPGALPTATLASNAPTGIAAPTRLPGSTGLAATLPGTNPSASQDALVVGLLGLLHRHGLLAQAAQELSRNGMGATLPPLGDLASPPQVPRLFP